MFKISEEFYFKEERISEISDGQNDHPDHLLR